MQPPPSLAPGHHPPPPRSAQRRSPPIVSLSRPLGLWLVQALTWSRHDRAHHLGIAGQPAEVSMTFLRWINWPVRLSPIGALERSYVGLVIGVAILLIVSSPWLFDRGLSWLYQQQRLSTRQLKTPEPCCRAIAQAGLSAAGMAITRVTGDSYPSSPYVLAMDGCHAILASPSVRGC
jgi:hypothetical protein